MSAVILIISYPAYFLRSHIIQLNIECFINSEFFIHSSLIIFVPYIASDFLRYIANDFLRQCIGLFHFTARPAI